MTTIGLIPTVTIEKSPVSYPCPPAMLPIDYQVINGQRCARPVCQLALEGLIRSGVNGVLFVLNHEHMVVMDYFRDGAMFGVPLIYMWQAAPGLVGSILSAYHVLRNHTVVMALPGITEPRHIKAVLDAHRTGGELLTMSVSPNAQLDDHGGVISAPGQQMMGIYVWSPAFTERLRTFHIQKPKITLEEVIKGMASDELAVRAIKLGYSPFIGSTASWTRVLNLPDPERKYEPQALNQIEV